MVDFELVSTILFFTAIGLFLIYDRKNVQFSYGIAVRRWNKGIYHIDNIIKRHRKFITVLGNISAVIGIVGGIVGLAVLVFFTVSLQQAFGLVLPSVSGYQYPGPVFSIPFWYWIIGIFLLLTTHETMHAVFARLEGVKVKNYGLAFLIVLPIAAFVDPDEKQIKKLSTLKKLRILSAGSFINLITGVVLVGLFFLTSITTGYLFQNSGVDFKSTIEETPAAIVGLGGTILKINNENVNSIGSLSSILENVKPGDVIKIETTKGAYNLKTVESPDVPGRAYIGISSLTNVYSWKLFFSGVVPNSVIGSFENWFRLLYWLTLLSFGIGVANLLPMKPFDGGKIFEEIFSRISKNYGRHMINVSTAITAALILFNLFGIGIVRSFL